MISEAKEHGVRFSRVGIQKVLNPVYEDDVLAYIDVQSQEI